MSEFTNLLQTTEGRKTSSLKSKDERGKKPLTKRKSVNEKNKFAPSRRACESPSEKGRGLREALRHNRINSEAQIPQPPKPYKMSRNSTQSRSTRFKIGLTRPSTLVPLGPVDAPQTLPEPNSPQAQMNNDNEPVNPIRRERSRKIMITAQISRMKQDIPQEGTQDENNPQTIISPTQEITTEEKKEEEEINIQEDKEINIQKEEKIINTPEKVKQCIVCMDAPTEAIIILCGHFAMCMEDAKQLKKCPICRIDYSPEHVIKVYHIGIDDND